MKFTRKQGTTAAGVLTVLVSLLVLTGWFLNIAVLKSVLPDYISMKFNTAICFLLIGISLLLLEKQKARPVAVASMLLVMLVGILSLYQYVFATNIGIDELLWKEGPGTAYTIYPGRPSAFTAIIFILLGFVLLNIHNRSVFVVSWLALAVSSLVAAVSVISYLFGNPTLISIPSLTVIALHTSVLFLVICLGIYQTDYFNFTRVSFQRRMIAGFLIIGFGLLLIVYLDNKADRNFINTTKLVSNNNESIILSDDIISALTGMESGTRGYLLTREAPLLAPLNQGKEKLFVALDQLKALVSGNTLQEQRMDTLGLLVARHIRLLDTMMRSASANSGVNNKARAVIVHSPALMNRIIQILNNLKQEEKNVLQYKQEQNNRNIRNANQAILFLGFCILVIFISTILFVFRNTNARIRAEEDAKHLAATLEKKVHDRTEQLNNLNNELQRLTSHLQTMREEERQHISREVYDELGQLASALKMDIDWLQMNITDTDHRVKKRLGNATYISQTMINTVHKIASSLRPVMIDELGLNASLKWQCDQYSKTNGVSCEFTDEFDDTGIPEKISTSLFRICQESLANVQQHAQANRVSVTLEKNNGSLTLTVADNGNGFDMDKKSDRLGLVGIRERVHSVNGTLRIQTGPGRGTSVSVTVPLGVGVTG